MFPIKSAGIALGALALALSTSGCATQKYVDEKVAGAEARSGAALSEQGTRIGALETRLNEVDQTARDALARAIAAGKLTEGRFLMTVVLTDDGAKFTSGKTALSADAQARLTDLATRLKTENQNVYLEIQGHTDSVGKAAVNDRIGAERAEAVRRFLAKQGVPASRMTSLSYGEDAPIADNATRAGRAANRRVAVVVLQ